MISIDIVKNLVKKKIQIHDLDVELTDEEYSNAEQLIFESHLCFTNIKTKIREKSQITKQFKSNLDDEQRNRLKGLVSQISVSIKQLEGDLKDKEAKLYNLCAKSDSNEIPTQFICLAERKETIEHPVFSVINTNEDWASDWNSFLASTASHSTYHRSEWLQVISDYSEYEIYIFVLESNGKILAGAPMLFMRSALFGANMISIPYVNYGGILSHSEKFTKDLLQSIKEWSNGKAIDCFEFRTTTPGLNLPVKSQKCSMILPLPFNDANLESALGAKLRAQCKKAAMHDPEVTFGGLELLDQFYYVFSTNMRDLGTPVYSKKFFEKILQEKKISSFICIVKVKNKPVSAAFLTGYRDMLEIPWASTLRAANKYDSNMWMYRMILKRAIELEYRFFDFGRSTKYSNTYKFKKQWGAKPVDHHWYYLIDSDSMPEINTDNPKYRIFIAIWKRLPVWIANIIGPYIVKRIP